MEWNDATELIPQTMALRKQNPNLKILLSIGGWCVCAARGAVRCGFGLAGWQQQWGGKASVSVTPSSSIYALFACLPKSLPHALACRALRTMNEKGSGYEHLFSKAVAPANRAQFVSKAQQFLDKWGFNG
jgi:GH18 family chitinase